MGKSRTKRFKRPQFSPTGDCQAEAAAAAGVQRLTHISAIGADANGKATRVGFKIDGDKKVRIAKTTGDVI